jgi:hypothetical protein
VKSRLLTNSHFWLHFLLTPSSTMQRKTFFLFRFFSTSRITRVPACVSQIGTAAWTPNALHVLAGAQLTVVERSWRRRKDVSSESFQMPVLTEVKDSIITLLQLNDKLIYVLIKEPGIGIVAMIIRHGLLLDCFKGVPVLDLSICFLSASLSPAMANAVHHMNSPEGMRHIKMWKAEYQLFQNLCNYSRASVSPSLRGEHPELRSCVASKDLRRYFRRVLLWPLF